MNHLRFFAVLAIPCLLVAAVGAIVYEQTRPLASGAPPQQFEVQEHESFTGIAGRLATAHLIRSATAFIFAGYVEGESGRLQAGKYLLSGDQSALGILFLLTHGAHQEVRVTVPEGASVFEIDQLLSDNLVLQQGALIAYASSTDIEGKLFPDTYDFYTNSAPETVVKKMMDTFAQKAAPLLPQDPVKARQTLILASLLEREVPTYQDRQIVAGIIEKRLQAKMALQIDATICYIKKEAQGHTFGPQGCYPLSPLDFKIDSPYNTYLYRGLPPGPIGSPGVSAISAALDPVASPYWFYLSDPATKQTIFSRTLDEQNENRKAHLM